METTAVNPYEAVCQVNIASRNPKSLSNQRASRIQEKNQHPQSLRVDTASFELLSHSGLA